MDSDDERLEIDMTSDQSTDTGCAGGTTDGGGAGDWGLRCAESGPWQGRAVLLPLLPDTPPEDLSSDQDGERDSGGQLSALEAGPERTSVGGSPAATEEEELEDGELPGCGELGAAEAMDEDVTLIEEEFLEVARNVLPAVEEVGTRENGNTHGNNKKKSRRDKKRRKHSEDAHADKVSCYNLRGRQYFVRHFCILIDKINC